MTARGETKAAILNFIGEHEKGVKEPLLRCYLQDKYQISASKGIKIHLEQLVSDNLIYKIETRGGPNIWHINPKGVNKIKDMILEIETKLNGYRKLLKRYEEINAMGKK